MANLGTLYAQIGLDTALLKRNAGEAQSILNSSVNSMKSTLAGLAGVLGVGMGVAGLVAVVKSAVSSYSDAESSIKRLSIAVESTGAVWESAKDGIISYTQEMQKTTRFSDEEVQASLSRVINLTGNVGESFRITSLAADLAAAGFGGLEETTSLLSRTMSGNTMMLEKQLPILKEMFKDLGEGATNAQKAEVAFRYLNERWGGAAQKDLLTFAGAMQSLKNWVDEIKEAFGGVIAIQLLPRIREWRDAIIGFIESGKVDKWAKDFGEAIVKYGGMVKDWMIWLWEHRNTIKTAFEIFLTYKIIQGINSMYSGLVGLATQIGVCTAQATAFALTPLGAALLAGTALYFEAKMILSIPKEEEIKNAAMQIKTYLQESFAPLDETYKKTSAAFQEIAGLISGTVKGIPAKIKLPGIDLGGGVKERKIQTPEMDLGIFKSSIDLQVAGYKDLLDHAVRTKADLSAVWGDYSRARIEQIKMEGEEMFKQGAPIELILQLSRFRIADLEKERKGLLDNTAATKELLDTSVGLYQGIFSSEVTSIETKKALWEDYKNVRFLQIEAEAKKLEELGVSQSLIDATVLAEKAEVLSQERELYAEHSEFVRGIYQGLYQGIGDFAGNMVKGMFDTHKSFYANLQSAAKAFGDFLINLLGSLVATWITSHLIEIGLFKTKEMAKTAILAQEIAKRKAMEAAASFLGPLGTIAGLFSLAFSKGGLVQALQTGGMVTGGIWGRDSVPIIAMPGEYYFKEPSARKIGIPALEYMNRTGTIPGKSGDTTIQVEMGDFNFGGMNRRDALLFPLEFKDKVLEVFKELVKKHKLEI